MLRRQFNNIINNLHTLRYSEVEVSKEEAVSIFLDSNRRGSIAYLLENVSIDDTPQHQLHVLFRTGEGLYYISYDFNTLWQGGYGVYSWSSFEEGFLEDFRYNDNKIKYSTKLPGYLDKVDELKELIEKDMSCYVIR